MGKVKSGKKKYVNATHHFIYVQIDGTDVQVAPFVQPDMQHPNLTYVVELDDATAKTYEDRRMIRPFREDLHAPPQPPKTAIPTPTTASKKSAPKEEEPTEESEEEESVEDEEDEENEDEEDEEDEDEDEDEEDLGVDLEEEKPKPKPKKTPKAPPKNKAKKKRRKS